LTNIAIRLEFGHFSKRDNQFAVVGIDTGKRVLLQSKVDQFVVNCPFTRHGSRQLVVIDRQRLQPAIAYRVVRQGQRPAKLVVVQVQMTQIDKRFSNIVWESTRQLIAAHIEIFCLVKKRKKAKAGRENKERTSTREWRVELCVRFGCIDKSTENGKGVRRHCTPFYIKKLTEKAKSQVIWKWTRKIVRVDIEVFCNTSNNNKKGVMTKKMLARLAFCDCVRRSQSFPVMLHKRT
jgi:hypothetical protein